MRRNWLLHRRGELQKMAQKGPLIKSKQIQAKGGFCWRLFGSVFGGQAWDEPFSACVSAWKSKAEGE